jgi:pimeloyl-ACP methyl ester carboxylesterase
MLRDDHTTLFERFQDALHNTGAELPGGEGDQAGIGDSLRDVWTGAKEALRQATYWQMKNRAGVVGRRGFGPLIGELHQALPDLRVHLVGHSFGARLVANALAGLPDSSPSPVASLTLLQGAFSHFAFADPLPFDAGRHGALAGLQRRVDGPITVCFSSHDSAVGTLYPLASLASGDDSAGANNALYRWGGMGADGAQNDDVALDGIQPAGPGTTYRFSRDRILNIDASEVVRRGGPPSGAHSDIVHPELTWVVLAASSLV